MEDMACTLNKHKINIEELNEFIKWVDTPEFALKKHEKISRIILNSSGDEINEPNKLTSRIEIRNNKKINKTRREYLGYCDDPENRELIDRQSDEEFEYVYDYMPLMTREQPVIKIGNLKISFFLDYASKIHYLFIFCFRRSIFRE